MVDVIMLSDEDVIYLNSLSNVSLFPDHLKPPTLNSKVGVIERHETGGRSAYAMSKIFKGEIITQNDATIINRAIKYSWQVGFERHFIGPGILDHSCKNPTCVINNNNEFIAFRDIEKDELLTFNYLTTEYELNSGFNCICGDTECYGYIRGFKYLSSADKIKLIANFGISEYLKSLYNTSL